MIVIDCSYMLALVLRDETRPASHPRAQGARLFEERRFATPDGRVWTMPPNLTTT